MDTLASVSKDTDLGIKPRWYQTSAYGTIGF